MITEHRAAGTGSLLNGAWSGPGGLGLGWAYKRLVRVLKLVLWQDAMAAAAAAAGFECIEAEAAS